MLMCHFSSGRIANTQKAARFPRAARKINKNLSRNLIVSVLPRFSSTNQIRKNRLHVQSQIKGIEKYSLDGISFKIISQRNYRTGSKWK